jgi:hypothetical protein
MFQTKVLEKSKHIVCVQYFFSKIVPLQDNVEKYCRTEYATGDNMDHALCMLNT